MNPGAAPSRIWPLHAPDLVLVGQQVGWLDEIAAGDQIDVLLLLARDVA